MILKIICITHNFLRWKKSIQVIMKQKSLYNYLFNWIPLQFSCMKDNWQVICSIQCIELAFFFYSLIDKIRFWYSKLSRKLHYYSHILTPTLLECTRLCIFIINNFKKTHVICIPLEIQLICCYHFN